MILQQGISVIVLRTSHDDNKYIEKSLYANKFIIFLNPSLIGLRFT
jgi:hypothetical protein